MENSNNHEIMSPDVILTQSSIENLRNSVPWMKFISILGFIGGGFTMLAAFFMMGNIGLNNYESFAGFGVVAFFIYLLFAIMIIFPNIYLFNYAQNLGEFCKSNDISQIEKAFVMHRKYWKILGILAIIYISLILIVFMFAIIAAIMTL